MIRSTGFLGAALGLLLMAGAVLPAAALADVLPEPGYRPPNAPRSVRPPEPSKQTTIPSERATGTPERDVGPFEQGETGPFFDLPSRYAEDASDALGLLVVWLAAVFIVPLGLTLLIELPVVAVAGRDDLRRAIKAGILVNTLTNPVLVLAVLVLASALPYYDVGRLLLGSILVLEAVIIVVEWRLYRWTLGWTNRRALVTAVLANGLSYVLGSVLVFWISALA